MLVSLKLGVRKVKQSMDQIAYNIISDRKFRSRSLAGDLI